MKTTSKMKKQVFFLGENSVPASLVKRTIITKDAGTMGVVGIVLPQLSLKYLKNHCKNNCSNKHCLGNLANPITLSIFKADAILEHSKIVYKGQSTFIE